MSASSKRSGSTRSVNADDRCYEYCRMSDRVHTLDDTTMKFGLLMESVQAHQKLAETHLEELRAHTRDLDGVVISETIKGRGIFFRRFRFFRGREPAATA